MTMTSTAATIPPPHAVTSRRRIIAAITDQAMRGVALSLEDIEQRTGASYDECRAVRDEMEATGELARLKARAKEEREGAAKPPPHAASDDEIRASVLAAAARATLAGEPATLNAVVRHGARGKYHRVRAVFAKLEASGELAARVAAVTAPVRATFVPADIPADVRQAVEAITSPRIPEAPRPTLRGERCPPSLLPPLSHHAPERPRRVRDWLGLPDIKAEIRDAKRREWINGRWRHWRREKEVTA